MSKCSCPIQAHMGIAGYSPGAAMVEQWQVWHLHSLGRLFGSRLFQKRRICRMVSKWFAKRRLRKNEIPQRKFWRSSLTMTWQMIFMQNYLILMNGQNLFEESGAKYIVLTSKHHDGFCFMAQ